LLGGNTIQLLFSVIGGNDSAPEDIHPVMTAMGPVAHIYLEESPADTEKKRIASELAQVHRVPVILTRSASGKFSATTATAELQLPDDLAILFGADHPFIDALGDDLLRLCQHPDAGDLILLGWCHGVTALSFAEENGAHGGITPEETNGFALLPGDTRLSARQYPYLRPADLRNAALSWQGRSSEGNLTGT
jgi:hypothetical protein